jgi:alpha-1,2-mannosyltransferase
MLTAAVAQPHTVDARRSPWLSRALMLAALVTLVVGVQQYHRVVVKLQDPAGGHINDFDRWMLMTPAFVRDHADYLNDRLPTPPLSFLLLAPFTTLPRPAAQLVWVAMKLPLAIAVFLLTLAVARRSGAPVTPGAAVLVLAGWAFPVVLDMQEGQLNFVVLLPLVAALYLAQEQERVPAIAAGILLGLAAAFKVTPFIFIVYFAWRRRWIVAGTALLSVIVWSTIVPGAVFGWSQTWIWLGEWFRIMIVPYVGSGAVVYAASQSFGSVAWHLLSRVPLFETTRDGETVAHYMNVMHLGTDAVFAFVRGVMLVVLLFGLWWMRRPLRDLRSPRYLAEIAAVAAFMLWFSERTWIHHYVSFVLTLAAAAAVTSDAASPEPLRRRARFALLMFAAAALPLTEVGRVAGPDVIDWVQGAGVYLVASVLVVISAVNSCAIGEAAGRAATSFPVVLSKSVRRRQ